MAERSQVRQTARSTEALGVRLVGALTDAAELLTVYLGDRLGLYRALADDGPLDAPALATAAGIAEPYAREWLAQQAIAGIVQVDDPGAEPEARRYALIPDDAAALTEADDLAYLAPVARLVPAVVRALPGLLDAFRSGGGVPYVDYGADAREALADLNRPRFLELLPTEWLAEIPDVARRLRSERAARVADLACGAGWSAIAIARAYPDVRVVGFDSDEASIDLARANAREAGVSERVRFHVRDVADSALGGEFDLVWGLVARDGAADPVAALRAMRRLAAGGEPGAVVVMSLRAAEKPDEGDALERLLGAAGVLFLLPIAIADQPARTTGLIRAEALSGHAAEAGFGRVEPLPIQHRLWSFYRLHT